MPVRRLIVWITVALILLAGCSGSGTPSVVRSSPQPTTALTVMPTPPPPVPTLGPVPSNCPVTNAHPQTIFSRLSPVIGTSPVWATWVPGPSRFHILLPSPPYSPNSNYIAPYGWAAGKVIWEVGPDYTNLITLRGHDLFDNTPLLFQFNAAPTADAVLDPMNPEHPVPAGGPGWAEWGSYIVVPKAGCYQMDVSWPTGHWSVTFAAGV